jgi:hypothetical protein
VIGFGGSGHAVRGGRVPVRRVWGGIAFLCLPMLATVAFDAALMYLERPELSLNFKGPPPHPISEPAQPLGPEGEEGMGA